VDPSLPSQAIEVATRLLVESRWRRARPGGGSGPAAASARIGADHAAPRAHRAPARPADRRRRRERILRALGMAVEAVQDGWRVLRRRGGSTSRWKKT
jgi:hypothetical protein